MASLHLCCGDVYLKGYVNIDIAGVDVEFRPDDSIFTTVDNYYVDNFKEALARQQRRIYTDYITDITVDSHWDRLYREFGGKVTEILMVSSIEHFTRSECKYIFGKCFDILKPKGLFKFDFPDIKTAVKDIDTKPDEVMRLLYCSGKNRWSVHKWGFTFESAKNLLNEVGDWTEIVQREVVKHDYPMTGVWGIK